MQSSLHHQALCSVTSCPQFSHFRYLNAMSTVMAIHLKFVAKMCCKAAVHTVFPKKKRFAALRSQNNRKVLIWPGMGCLSRQLHARSHDNYTSAFSKKAQFFPSTRYSCKTGTSKCIWREFLKEFDFGGSHSAMFSWTD